MKHYITSEQKIEIEQARKKNKSKLIERRLKVLSLRAEGKKYEEIAEITGYNKSNVGKIIKIYFEKGLSEIISNKFRGNRRNMSYEEEEELLNAFAQKAEQGQVVEVKEIKKAYQEKVGHSIGGNQIYLVLNRHNWRKVMPRSRHPKKASDEAIEASKKLTKS